MSKDTIEIDLKERETLRKGLAKIRDNGQVPAVVHDHGKPSIHVMGDYRKVLKAYGQAGMHHPVNLQIGSKKRLALIKDADFEPTKRTLRHVVFQAIRQNEKVHAEIPVVLEGEDIPAEKAGLMVLKQLDYVEVNALPGNLPDQLTVDATKLAEVGDRLSVSDIKVPEGVELLVEPEHQIAVVEMPRDQVAEADAAAEALAEGADKPEDVEIEGEEKTEDETTEGEDKPSAEGEKQE